VKFDRKKIIAIDAISLTVLPASCGSFYTSMYVAGDLEALEACAYTCGEMPSSKSTLDGFLEAVLVISTIGLIMFWAWLVDKVIKKDW
jgi:hypothetical protein